MAEEDDLPGVVLRFKEGQQLKTNTGKRIARIVLEAEVNDTEIWDAVETKLRAGMKVYTINDFQTELAEALRKENESLERKLQALQKRHDALSSEARGMRSSLESLYYGLGDE